ncbi:diguanylate cyclase [Ralstonia insidiosa]|uniref:Diguanylate cyclase n=1 Tax=Ralstonia insidiosa TaxID=190721 RepID=A0A848P368_9RALS|nr:diguanylate cyclase [Ralstonia insidiosa]
MRINLPVTQRNVEISDNQRLISVTNRDGLIVFANKAFCDISGYTIGELLNQPHNLIRHPDMPVAVFADMWGTLEAGLPWSGLLKNRCKNGDHYWVRANMTPTRRAGELTGYMSVRIKPSPEDVEFAEQLYRRLQEGKDTSIFLDKGIPVRTGLFAWRHLCRRMSVRERIFTGCAASALLAAYGVATTGPGLLAAAIIAGLSALAGCLLMEGQLTKPLNRLLQQGLALAAGQPEKLADSVRTDEIGMLKRAINQACLNVLALPGELPIFGCDNGALSDMAQHGTADPTVMTPLTNAISSFELAEHALRVDGLTGAYNYSAFVQRLQRHLEEMPPAKECLTPVDALLFIDLDNFKVINDQHGHDVGNAVLVTAVDRMWKTVRGTDVVAR